MSNALTNDLCRRLGIRLPIFGLAHRIEVAAAISRAGGLGVYAAARDGPHELQKKLRQLRELCPDHPVGVDLLLPTGLGEEQIGALGEFLVAFDTALKARGRNSCLMTEQSAIAPSP